MSTYHAHPTAVIDDGCAIGDDTRIWHFSHVMAGARIGRACTIGQNVFIAGLAVIGNRVKIQNNVSIYDGIVLEDEVFCGPSMVFTNVTSPRSHISRRHQFESTLVRQGATLGANSTVLCGLTIGRYAFIGAGAVVTRDVADYALVVGNPARQVGWVCQCGVKLSGMRLVATTVACRECAAVYRVESGRPIERLSSSPVVAGARANV
jgi:UDP-2-acetamido-3-amino-2,3-dideoxy-glucuronate N-acetyltransferase